MGLGQLDLLVRDIPGYGLALFPALEIVIGPLGTLTEHAKFAAFHEVNLRDLSQYRFTSNSCHAPSIYTHIYTRPSKTAHFAEYSEFCLTPTEGSYLQYRFPFDIGQSVEYFRRTSVEGIIDDSFKPQLNFSSLGWSPLIKILPQADGKILILGNFNSVNAEPRNFMARLNANGLVDEHFNPQASTDTSASDAVLLPDGSYLLGGGFTQVNGVFRNFLARLHGDDSTPRPPTIVDPRPLQVVADGYSTNLTVVVDGPSLSYQWQFNGTNIAGATNEYLFITNTCTADVGAYNVIATNAWGAVTSAPVQLSVIRNLGEALNATNLVWKTSILQLNSSDPGWYPQTNITHDGVAALASALAEVYPPPLGYPSLTTRVTGPGVLSFWYSGVLSFECHSIDAPYFSSSPALYSPYAWAWENLLINIPSGTLNLTWKAQNIPPPIGDFYQYQGFLDEVAFFPTPVKPIISWQRQPEGSIKVFYKGKLAGFFKLKARPISKTGFL